MTILTTVQSLPAFLLCPSPTAAVELPPHLIGTRAAVAAAQVKRAERCASQRRRKGEPKNFNIGDAVLLKPPKMGKVGKTIGPNRLVCRVVGTTQCFKGVIKYKLRCNAGVLGDTWAPHQLRLAPAAAAAKLQFSGTDVTGVPKVTVTAAMKELSGGGVHCRCRSACGNNCACKKAGVTCGRHCGCKSCKGMNCGNY